MLRKLLICLRLPLLFSCILIVSNSYAADLLLWKATKQAQSIYLLGSVHVADPSFYPLANSIEEAFQNADALAVEANIEAVNFSQLSALIAQFPESTLTPQVKRKFSQALEKEGISATYIDQLPPVLLAMQLSMVKMSKAGYSSQYGIDKHFLQQANALNKPILELESVAEQFAILQTLDQNLFIENTLSEIAQLEGMITELMDAWKNGDVKVLERILFQDVEQYPDIYEKMLFKRNRNMLTKVEQYHQKKQTVFVIVGAAHLIGEKGLLNLLRQNDYQITQYSQ